MATFRVKGAESEPEFAQAVNEVLLALATQSTLFDRHPDLAKVLPVITEPERVIIFRVPWEDDNGQPHVQRGYRVQFNSALGPYKGGLRFHSSVNLSILKFLGFEQVFKNALTGLAMGGGKGGSDFEPHGRSDAEIRRFCVSFMTELQRHIGPDTDVPAGDIGVGGREVAYMFGQYRRLRNEFTGVLTGKGLAFGGSLIRPEATGFGLAYYVSHMLEHRGETWTGLRTLISGSGNVAQYAALKVHELGGIVLSLSDSKGAIIATNEKEGVQPSDVDAIGALKLRHGTLQEFAALHPDRFTYHAGARPWTLVKAVDVALPCATQNEVSADEAKALLAAGCRYVAEGSNMGSTPEAIDLFEAAENCWYAPGKASNAGGVAVSGLEMAQNSQRQSWTREQVDERLKGIMASIYNAGFETAKMYERTEGKTKTLPSLLVGSNVAGFKKVAEAMHSMGEWW
eukprot:comp22470_c0_seq1/m.33853 comp22470_c0_seq1/g.33853  ORF comp22470_c0_seq1/g.33853 comp22470_c0_seq1/m.33853 type:complete len:456 (-) comp22470_c0_seq1:505-1872(-)